MFEHGRTDRVWPFRRMQAERAPELGELAQLLGGFAGSLTPQPVVAAAA